MKIKFVRRDASENIIVSLVDESKNIFDFNYIKFIEMLHSDRKIDFELVGDFSEIEKNSIAELISDIRGKL